MGGAHWSWKAAAKIQTLQCWVYPCYARTLPRKSNQINKTSSAVLRRKNYGSNAFIQYLTDVIFSQVEDGSGSLGVLDYLSDSVISGVVE